MEKRKCRVCGELFHKDFDRNVAIGKKRYGTKPFQMACTNCGCVIWEQGDLSKEER